ncbi:large with domain of nucleoporin [Cryptosporidium sp. chipmunk genotype I]|uniref:large with domain of nucleoporin n=1 Tax=Cryptosporidium sp. chipmunk genotype I TaxID=1280935 RepID=UPI00351A5403|nr:large with domain of nucleoporin [Cryptosporidium sp. chipmunk genotype I]
MFDNNIRNRNEDFFQLGSGNQINTKLKNMKGSLNLINKGNDPLDFISKSDVIGTSLNSCIKQDEEFSELNHFLKGIYSTDYEHRPEAFEVKALNVYFPNKIKQTILNNLKNMKLNLKDSNDRKNLIHKISSEHLALKSKTLNNHSIFYIYYENEIIFWNWSKDDPIYSVQTEEFFQENTRKKAIITSVGSLEDENSSFIKILVCTSYYVILLNIVRNTNGNYIINRIKDSYHSLSGFKDISFTNIISHQASGRFFLGCGNTGNIYEYTMEQESSWIKKKVQKISDVIYNDSQNHSIARLIKISGNNFVSYLPRFIRNYFFGQSQSFIKSMFIDEFRGLLYVLYMNSDIDVFLIPIGNFFVKKISDDLTYIEKKDSSNSINAFLTKYLSSNTLSLNSFSTSNLIFRLNINTLKSELSKLINSNNNKKQFSVTQQKKNSNFISYINIHSIHPTNPQESDFIYAILVTNHGDRIYLESVFEFGSKPCSASISKYNNQSPQNLKYLIPINMRVKEFKKTSIISDDSEEKLINSSLYSNGVSILTTVNIGDGVDLPDSVFSQKSEMNFGEIPENLYDDNDNILSLITSNISASCIDQTVIAKSLSNRNSVSSNIQNTPLPHFNEWQYSFSDPNLGLILSIQERNVPMKYQRLFENLWNTPNPFSYGNNNSKEILLIRPNISASNHDQLLSSSNLSGFGCRTSGSKFFHLWRYFFNRINSKSVFAIEANEETKPHCLIQKYLSSSTSCSVFGINIPKCPPNGLNDLILDQITECRSWTIISTKGIFILEKKRLLDIITKMTLEPHNYSFMMNVFDDHECFSPMNGLKSFGGRSKDDSLQNNRSITFVMKLLGTFAQNITFEQFFALIWQGLIGMNTKEILDSELIQRFYSSDIKNDSPFEIHIRNKDVGMFDKNFTQNDFPSITLIKIWLTLLSDSNIQSRSNSNCFLSINSCNHRLAVTPRCKGLLLLIGRVIRSIWCIPLFQQTSFELINNYSSDFSRYIDEGDLLKNQLNQSDNNNDEFDSKDFSMNDNGFKFVSEFIKSQIDSSEHFYNSYQNYFLLLKDSNFQKSSSCRNKNIVLEIQHCINEFFKSEASDWLTHNQIDTTGSSEVIYNNDKISNKASGLIPENNTNEFAMNDSISVTIFSSLKEDHISHLKNNLIPINNILDLLLPWWFPNYNVEINRSNNEDEIVFANHYSTNSSFNNSNFNSNSYSLVNISELQLFIEIKNFISRTIEILEMMNLFCKTYPLGLKYNAKITNEAILCFSYMDILKKSLTKFTLFELSNNKGLQFILRLLFRYNILSASQYMSVISSKSKYSLISYQQFAIEYSISSLNKDIILNKRNKTAHGDDLLIRKNLARASRTKNKGNKQLVNSSHSQIMSILFENVYEVPLNIVLSLLYYKKEISSIITFINSQSEYIHHTGLLPPWLSNGEKVEIYIPTSISEFSSHISKSNSFVKYFLSILIFEINQCEPQYNNRLMSFQDILVNFEQSGCKTLLEFCKTSSLTHVVRSIYTYEFHCSLWIYQNLQHTLDIIYSEYIVEIEMFLSKIDLVDDPSFDYLKELDVSFNHLKSSGTASEQKLLEDGLAIFKNLRENILKTKSSIVEFILCSLKQQESNYNLKFNKQSQKLFLSTCKEWLHYYLFSYVSYIDSCMQKTVHEEIVNRKGGKRLENWLIKNLCISVFQFSEHSVYLKNWLEHFHLSENHSYSAVVNENKEHQSPRLITNTQFSGSFDKTSAGLFVNQGYGSNLPKKLESDYPSRNNYLELTENNYNNENNLRKDQGYLLYNAKQYLSAGQYYYSKSRAMWKIPSGVNLMISRTQRDIFKSASRGGDLSSSAMLKEINNDEIMKMQDFMKRSLETYKRRISSSSFIQARKRLDNIFDLMSDIHLQVLKMQQDPTLIQRRSLLLQSQTCIERDMNDDKNKEFIKNIRNDIFNIDTQIEILLQISEFINYYILSALEQNVNINPLVKQIFDLFGNSIGNDTEISHLNENFDISQEGIDIFKSLIMGIFHIQSMVHTDDTLMEFITEFYNLTGFSSITEIKWLMENSKNQPRIINHIIVKISSLCEYRIKQAFFFESPILFEVDIANLLRLCENSMPYDLILNQNNQSIRSGMSSRMSFQQFDSILETIILELYKFSILYYNKFRQSDLVDIYSFEDVTRVKSRVLWWVWPIRFLIFHLNSKSIVSRLLPLFSGNSNNSNILSNMISNHERMEISEIIKASIV